MREELRKIYELQNVEKEIKLLYKKIKTHPVIDQFNALKAELKEKKSQLDFLAEEIKKEKARMHRLELDNKGLYEEIRELKGKVFSGEIRNTKELEQYEKKLQQKEREKDNKENETITLMEELEKKEKLLEQLNKEFEEGKTSLHELQVEGQAELDELKHQIGIFNLEKEKIKKTVNANLLQAYEKDAGKFKGQYISKVENNTCGGCRVFLSSAVISMLDDPASLIKCENCGRLLLKT